MKYYFLTLLYLFLVGCGIDKEPGSVTLPSFNSGELDTSFFSKGYYTIDGSAGGTLANDEIHALAKDSQNRIIAVGTSHNGSNADVAVWRLTSSGAVDTSFGTGGVFIHNSAAGGNSTDLAYGVAIDGSDNIYLTGTSYTGTDFDMFVMKLTSAGALDTSFAGTGIFVDGGAFQDQGSAIHLDASGRILVTGFSDQTLPNRDMALWRITTAGVLDNTFSGDGIFTHDSAAGGEDDMGNDIATDSTGNIFVVGRADSVANFADMAVWKITDSGNLDTGFSGTGFFTHNGAAGASNADVATAFVINEDGNLIITGYSRNATGNNDMVLWSILPSGGLDTTFDADGYVTFDVSSVVGGATNDTGEDIIIDSDGRYVISGSGNEDLCLWRFNTDGTIDENFNTDGFFSHDSAAGGFGIDSGTSLVEGANYQLYIGGFSETTGGDFDATFWRLK